MKSNYNLQCKTLIITAFTSLVIISILTIIIIYQRTIIYKLKDSKTSKFFVEAKFTKEQVDTTTLNNLKFLIDSKNISEENKKVYIAKYADLVMNINNQTRIETILKAKGYEDSVVFINNNRAIAIIKYNKTLKSKQLNEIKKVITDISGIKDIEIATKS